MLVLEGNDLTSVFGIHKTARMFSYNFKSYKLPPPVGCLNQSVLLIDIFGELSNIQKI